MPKSRRTKRAKRKKRAKKIKKTFKTFWVFLFLLIFFFVLFFVYELSSVKKFFFVNKTSDGAGEVVIYNPDSNSVIKILLPADTQLELSEDLGVYKLENAWKLAEKEGLRGKLVAKSLVKNLSIPLHYYKEGNSTNLDLFKRVKVFLFERKIGNYLYSEIDLTETKVLSKKKLLDSSYAHLIVSDLPATILVNFADESLKENPAKVEIVDKSANSRVSESVSFVLSVMGLKVSSYSKETPSEINCIVSGENKSLVNNLAKVFDCSKDYSLEGESDIKMVIGRIFVEKY